jgi:hypothetical protein
MSRTTRKEYINFGNYKTVLKEAVIYRYHNSENNENYIGNSFDFKQRQHEHLTSKDNSEFHTLLQKNRDIFKVSSLKHVHHELINL